MFTLIKHADVYAPQHLGEQDILFCNDKIIAIAPEIDFSFADVTVIDAAGKKAVPGFIDQHVHVLGGGGEGSFHSRCPELDFSQTVKNGVTTVVGMLGTDSMTRSIENLVAKTKALNEDGITAYCLTGAYEFPSPTLAGSVKKDVTFLSECIGVKIAISDHRNSCITTQELARLAADVRQAALFSGKVGVVHMHTGRGKSGLSQVMAIVENTDVPIKHFRPTHCGNQFDDAVSFAAMGGWVDFTTYEDSSKSAKMLKRAIDSIEAVDHITCSSDSNGSMPKWNEKNEMIGMGIGSMSTLYAAIKALVQEENVPLEEALPLITSNVARGLEIYPKKGCLAVDSDADLVLLDTDLNIDSVFAKGKVMMKDKKVLAYSYFGK
ncbi:MAG: beta-aspartyl-peptidase [Oscillospiraceae bacterium]|nr:beta-aspartyl-peptidase [Oscillospiraceae bacterium]